jgi:hypothetical protein
MTRRSKLLKLAILIFLSLGFLSATAVYFLYALGQAACYSAWIGLPKYADQLRTVHLAAEFGMRGAFASAILAAFAIASAVRTGAKLSR